MADLVENLFVQSEARIRKNREFLTRLWHLENDERPGFLIGYTGPRMRGGIPVRSAMFSTEGTDTVLARLQDPEKLCCAQLEEIAGQLSFRGDFVPTLCPTLGVVGIPSAFGCEVIWWERDFPAVRPVQGAAHALWSNTPLPSPEAGELGRILEYTRRFCTHARSRLPIRVTDIQGPLDSAALIAGHSNFLAAMVDRPAEAHRLLHAVTELTIAFVRRQREVVRSMGAEFVPAMFQPWMPDVFGISVSNDECVMISAEMHDEFCVRYLNMLSEEFGGIYIHSCGDWRHQIPSLKHVRNLRGLEFGASETPFEDIAPSFSGRTVLACRVGLHRDITFNGMSDFVRHIRRSAPSNRGLFIHADITNGIVPEDWPETDLDEIYHLLEPPKPA